MQKFYISIRGDANLSKRREIAFIHFALFYEIPINLQTGHGIAKNRQPLCVFNLRPLIQVRSSWAFVFDFWLWQPFFLICQTSPLSFEWNLWFQLLIFNFNFLPKILCLINNPNVSEILLFLKIDYYFCQKVKKYIFLASLKLQTSNSKLDFVKFGDIFVLVSWSWIL